MAFLIDDCVFVPLSKGLEIDRPLNCGDKDLDDFFASEYEDYAKELFGNSYCFLSNDDRKHIVCAFTLSNSSIFTGRLPNARRKKVGKEVPYAKRDLVYPAVLIGRLGIDKEYQAKGIGAELLDYIKQWLCFSHNKSACRYLIVDAYNNEKVLSYYQRNGFDFVFSSEQQEIDYRAIDAERGTNTRLMYFDLIRLLK